MSGSNPIRDDVLRFLNDALGDGGLTLPVRGRVEGANGAGFDVECYIDAKAGLQFVEYTAGTHTILRYPITVYFIGSRNKGAEATFHNKPVLPGLPGGGPLQ